MSGCEVFEITLTRGYDETMFREDLKQLYTLLGSDNKKVRVTDVLAACKDTTLAKMLVGVPMLHYLH